MLWNRRKEKVKSEVREKNDDSLVKDLKISGRFLSKKKK